MINQVDSNKKLRAGNVAIVGLSNVGKSTLFNQFVGVDISGVSAKEQTTRKNIRGIFFEPKKGQILFIDSPGFTEREGRIFDYIRAQIQSALKQADVVLFLRSKRCLDSKVDSMLNFYNLKKDSVFWVNGEMTTQKTRDLFSRLPLVDFLPYEKDEFTLETARELASEIVREAVFSHLYHEIPFGTGVRIVEYRENKQLTKIQADVIVNRKSHKKILIGKGGEMLKTIGTQARRKLEAMLDEKVFLKLHVAVRENWLENPGFLKEMGLYTKGHREEL